VGSARLLKDATLVLLESAPKHMPLTAIHEIVASFPGVVGVHDLHAWTLGAGHDAVTVHVKSSSQDPSLGQRLSDKLRTALEVEYVTVQVEVGDQACGAPPSLWDGGKDGGASGAAASGTSRSPSGVR
jgi:cobalt-zinc-cadmium efflux system protein